MAVKQPQPSSRGARGEIGTLVRDAAIILSFALQHGADIEAIRRALGRDGAGHALGPIAEALDTIASAS